MDRNRVAESLGILKCVWKINAPTSLWFIGLISIDQRPYEFVKEQEITLQDERLNLSCPKQWDLV